MSELIYKGDTTENFGEYMPVPYINRIYVSVDEAGTNSIDVTLNIFVKTPVEVDETTLIERLGGYTFYWDAMGFSSADEASHSEGATEENLEWVMLRDFLNGELNIYQLYGAAGARVGLTTGAWPSSDSTQWGQQFAISDCITAEDSTDPEYEVIYDENGDRILKFTYYSQLSGHTMGPDFDELLDNLWNEDETWYLFTWSTSEDFDSGWDDAMSSTAYNVNYGSPPEAMATLAFAETSDVAYEIFVQNGELYLGEEIVWVDGEGAVYSATALQSITGLYYKPDKLTHAEIVDSFQGLIDEYTILAETDSSLLDAVNNISYIITTYGASADLLPRLNEFRKAFPSKTSATTVGQLYAKYRKKIYTANEVVILSAQVYKRSVTSPKTILSKWVEHSVDTYTAPVYNASDYSLGTTDGTGASSWVGDDTCVSFAIDGSPCPLYTGDFIYYGCCKGLGLPITRVVYPGSDWDNPLTETVEGSDTSANDVGVWGMHAGVNEEAFGANFGMFFFDYDKAFYYTSFLAKHLDVSKIVTAFGAEYLNAAYSLKSVSIKRYRGTDLRMEMIQNYKQTTYPAPDPDNLATHIYYNIDAQEGEEAGKAHRVALNSDDTNNSSFVMLRNFDFPNELLSESVLADLQSDDIGRIDQNGTGYVGLPAFRWMGFEFQDIMGYYEQLTISDDVLDDGEILNRQAYVMEVVMRDDTAQILEAIINITNQWSSNLEEYVDAASETCAYNSATGMFNQYFTDSQLELYGDSLESAPWYKAPALYVYFEDLFYDVYSGDEEAQRRRLLEISYSISPETGTIEQLVEFYDSFTNLMSDWNSENMSSISTVDATTGVTTIENSDTEISFTCEVKLDLFPIMLIGAPSAWSDFFGLTAPGLELMSGYD